MQKKKSAGLFVATIAIAAKSSKLLSIFKLFKVAKPLVMFVSMSISAIAYAFWLGPYLALLFVLLLLIHEMGHVVAMKLRGLDTPTPVFIPFLGTAVFAPKFKDRETEAYVGFGGPLLGTIGSLVVFGLWFLIPENVWWAPIVFIGSYLGVYLNLFNLIPVSPLDGGRVTQAAGEWFKYIGLFALAGFSAWIAQPVILYVWILVLFDLDLIPAKLRAVLVSVLWVTMATLMSMGFGAQPYWANIIDCVLTAVFVGMAIARAFKVVEDVEEDTRPGLSIRERLRWLCYYVGLAAFLVALIILQAQYLPKH
jgi:Zn-dependent protease